MATSISREWLQATENGGHFFQRKRLGPDSRLDASSTQSLGQRLRIIVRLQIVPQCLSLKTERQLHKIDKFLFRYPQARALRLNSKPNYRGIHLGWRIEGAGRQGEQQLNLRIKLRCRGKQAVFPSARLGGETFGYLPLHHHYGDVEVLVELEHSKQNVRRNVIRQVADQVDLGRGLHQSWSAHSRLRTEHRAEVNGEHIAFNDLHIRTGRKPHAKLRRHHTVQFDCNYSARTLG